MIEETLQELLLAIHDRAWPVKYLDIAGSHSLLQDLAASNKTFCIDPLLAAVYLFLRLFSHYRNGERKPLRSRMSSSLSTRRPNPSSPRCRRGSGTYMSKNQQTPTLCGPMRARSNLECFLNHITPCVQCQYPPKSACADDVCHGWKCHTESTPFFNLGDLWRSFDEWSAYGAGVPLVLPCGETIVQYYVPYLSALQIYLQPGGNLFTIKRRPGDESDCSDVSDVRDTSSDFGSDYENEKIMRCQMKSDQWDSSSCVSSEQLSSASSEHGDRHADLVFEYFERGTPYSRAPLAGKINELAAGFPPLYSLNSGDLSSASWVSVAWYPIYRIPMGPTMSDLSTCFLTYHSLWTPPFLQGDAGVECLLKHDDGDMCVLSGDRSNEQEQEHWLRDHLAWRRKSRTTLELPAFGLSCYKLRGLFWDAAGPMDKHHLSELAASAESWLRQLRVQHPDFDFFASREGFQVYR